MKWTAEQLRSITTTGKSLLVSAAAGSGKTAVLAERCAYLVCDASNKCDIDELLVVTFTKAAAAEMKSRIEAALRARLAQQKDPTRLTRQLLLLHRAQISTLHGFCTAFLRRHFHLADLDPNFRVLDEEEVGLLKQDIARELLDHRYETDSAGEFQQFVDQYGTGDDHIVQRSVLHLHEMMCSVVDPDGWLKKAAMRIAEAKNASPLAKSEYGKQLAANIRSWLGDLNDRWIVLAKHINHIDGLDAYGEYVNDLRAAVEGWQSVFDDGKFDALSAEIQQFGPARLPSIKNPPPEKEIVQAQIEALRKEMKQSAIVSQCRFTEQQWRDGLAAIYTASKIFVELTREFRKRFGQAKRELRGLDFSDLERLTLNILREKPIGDDLTPSSVARMYQRQFAHVLVDEYQDINEVQDAILSLVSREIAGDGSNAEQNLFSVGDVKQSIYRFRLAQPGRFLDKYKRFSSSLRTQAEAAPTPSPGNPGDGWGEGSSIANRKSQIANNNGPHPNPLPDYRERGQGGQVIDLSANFRSRGPLLEVINRCFERLMVRDAVDIQYDQSHRLRPGAQYPADSSKQSFTGAPVELHLLCAPSHGGEQHEDQNGLELNRTEREAAFIARHIAQMMQSGLHVTEKQSDSSLGLRPMQYRDIVILLRSMRHKADQFAAALRSAGVPVHSESGTGFFQSMEIQDMLSLLRILDNQQQDVPLAAVLRSPLSGLAQPEDSLARIRLAYPNAHSIPFHKAVVFYADNQQDELAAHLRGFLSDLSDWRRLAHQRPLAEVLWHIYDTSGYLAFCSGLDDGEQRVANLIEFHERARQFASFHRQGLSRFMQFLDSLAEQYDLGAPSIASEADDVVRIMSVHRSKGLEFPVVIVPDLGKKHNFQDAQGMVLVDRDAGIGLMVADEKLRVKYPSLAHVLVQDRIKKQTLAEEMRVLYVAMTRAREHLILVGTCDESLPQQWREQWAAHAGPLPVQRILAAGTMLDWLGPVAAMTEGSRDQQHIQMLWHDEQELESLSIQARRKPALSDEQTRRARLEPLDPPPSADSKAQQIRERLTTKYRFDDFTRIPAAQSVGTLTKAGRFAPAGQSPSREGIISFEEKLPAPNCVLEQAQLAPTEIGTATHLLLEHLDFSRPCDAADLKRQVESLVDKKLLSAPLAGAVDLKSIAWLMKTDLGQRLRRAASDVKREVAIYYSLAPDQLESTDPLDRIMLRGRIDLLIAKPQGLTIVDFKTDQVTAETVDARVEFYRPQIMAYRDAICTIASKPVRSALLVFLAAQVIREV